MMVKLFSVDHKPPVGFSSYELPIDYERFFEQRVDGLIMVDGFPELSVASVLAINYHTGGYHRVFSTMDPLLENWESDIISTYYFAKTRMCIFNGQTLVIGTPNYNFRDDQHKLLMVPPD